MSRFLNMIFKDIVIGKQNILDIAFQKHGNLRCRIFKPRYLTK